VAVQPGGHYAGYVMQHLAELILAPMDFRELRQWCREDETFPVTWPAWEALMREARAEALAAGLMLPGVVVEPEVFGAWCNEVGIVPGLDALRAYGLVMRHRRAETARRTAADLRVA